MQRNNTPPRCRIGRFLLLALFAIAITSCYQQPSIIIPPYFWQDMDTGPEAVLIQADDIDVHIGDDSIDFSAYPLAVLYDDGTSEAVTFDISSQVEDYLEGGVAPVTVSQDAAEASFDVYFYDMEIGELVEKITALVPSLSSKPTALQELCSNKHILLTDYSAGALSIDRFDSQIGMVPVFENTYFRGANSGADMILTASVSAFPLEISAFGTTVENVNLTAKSNASGGRRGACAIYGNDILIQNATLVNDMSPIDGVQNIERTGITIEKGSKPACGSNPGLPETVVIRDTVISGFDVSVNISAFATLDNVTFDSPIIIAVADETRLDEIAITNPVSHVPAGEADVIIIAADEEQTTATEVLELQSRLEAEGLTVEIKAVKLEIGDITISPWEPGGTIEAEATME